MPRVVTLYLSHRSWLHLIIALLMYSACSSKFKSSTAELTVAVTGGQVAGFSESGIDRWYGIPFAAPPVGQLRWRTPQPVLPWDSLREATSFAAGPVQHNVWGDMRYRSTNFSEDCLYLNVWAPEGERSNLPVLLYYYGGGLIAGDASETRYDGAALAREGIIVVTANYRLNVFGWLAHPELSAESPTGTSGNYGHHDQVAALMWVRDNIAGFGGDPSRITIGGESAGSISVSTLLGSPATSGLLAGAIGQSGASFAPLYVPLSPDSAEAVGSAFAKTVGAVTLNELRAMDADTLYARYLRYGERLPLVVDGTVITQPLQERYEQGAVPSVPLLVGWNSRESGPELLMGERPMTPDAFKDAVRTRYPKHADQLLALMPHRTASEVEFSATALASDEWIAQPTWAWADAHTRYTDGPVYRYHFTQPRPGEQAGAAHAAEIPYALGNLAIHDTYAWEADDVATSETMLGFFANFIKTGNPNGEQLPDWTALKRGAVQQPIMRIAEESKAITVNDARYYLLRDQFRAVNQ